MFEHVMIAALSQVHDLECSRSAFGDNNPTNTLLYFIIISFFCPTVSNSGRSNVIVVARIQMTSLAPSAYDNEGGRDVNYILVSMVTTQLLHQYHIMQSTWYLIISFCDGYFTCYRSTFCFCVIVVIFLTVFGKYENQIIWTGYPRTKTTLSRTSLTHQTIHYILNDGLFLTS